MNDIEQDLIRNVCIQRDGLKMVLSGLCDSIRQGVYNHMLPDRTDRAHASPDEKCKKGFLRSNVLWGMAKCCMKCDGIGKCHLSFEEKRLFEAMHDAMSAVEERPAEMPDVQPADFPKYIPGKSYSVTPRWVARELYKFCVGYWIYCDHSDPKIETEWEKSFDDLLCIMLDSIGRNGFSFRKFLGIAEKGEVDDDSKKFVEAHPEIEEISKSAVDSMDVEVKEDDGVEILIMHAVLLRMDYQFNHEYPGCDIGVYGDVFGGIIDGCLTIAGLYPKDRPRSYDFEDKGEYRRKLLEYEVLHKERIFEFVKEEDGLLVSDK